ncbi:hypothetical protein [Mangrovibacterium lignilyticum]|uniref:hypothetical protein n=1 Tax=Mangrovibacterium lignilyticum TaxID=2668052 RepID=UPI0013D42147|nr:hypothetical protein [Mangrovibacterium lignilyticum]
MTAYSVSRNFSSNKLTNAGLSVFAGSVKEKMTANPNFVTPVPTLEELTAALDAYDTALDQARDRGTLATSVKNDKKDALIVVLKALADYVDETSGGDRTIILSSGFELTKPRSTIGPLPRATGLVVEAGDGRGSLKLSCDVLHNARAYLFQYTDAPLTAESIWRETTNTRHIIQIDNLTPGKEYVFRAAYAGSNPSRKWSDPVNSYVL